MSSPEVYSLKPTPDQYAYAFGGREPLLTVEPGSIVDLATEDCFARQRAERRRPAQPGVHLPVPEPGDRTDRRPRGGAR